MIDHILRWLFRIQAAVGRRSPLIPPITADARLCTIDSAVSTTRSFAIGSREHGCKGSRCGVTSRLTADGRHESCVRACQTKPGKQAPSDAHNRMVRVAERWNTIVIPSFETGQGQRNTRPLVSLGRARPSQLVARIDSVVRSRNSRVEDPRAYFIGETIHL
jgi:hypothetical protein